MTSALHTFPLIHKLSIGNLVITLAGGMSQDSGEKPITETLCILPQFDSGTFSASLCNQIKQTVEEQDGLAHRGSFIIGEEDQAFISGGKDQDDMIL